MTKIVPHNFFMLFILVALIDGIEKICNIFIFMLVFLNFFIFALTF